MIKNRQFALAFRIAALLIAAIGLMKQLGVYSGDVYLGHFMYYTIQSNLLAIFLFAMLTVRTAIGLGEGKHGSAGWYPRFEMVCVVDLLVTLIVFWTLLSSALPNLWTFENLSVHAITPLLCLTDYILFAAPGHLKYRDVYYVCIFPLGYVVFTIIARYSGYIYRYELIGINQPGLTPARYPYFFLDFDTLGAMALAYIGGLLVFFILLSHGLYFADRKLRKPPLAATRSQGT